MFVEDLCPYAFGSFAADPNLLAVGWLDEHHDFPKGVVPETCLSKILDLCFSPVNQMRGFHISPFIKSPNIMGYPIEHKGKRMLLGSAEIRVSGKNGRNYAAPNLIYHYIKDCGYLPPQEFLEALSL